jgi:5-dehydro-4-deoxyglucarate dehydratase
MFFGICSCLQHAFSYVSFRRLIGEIMTRMSTGELGSRIGTGLLSFPVTHFTERFEFDERPYRDHLEWLLQHHPAALFAAGGTGEFFSLTSREFSSVVSSAVEQTKGRVPVIAGCGYGTAMAKEFAQTAEAAGADGLLLLPPYLLNSDSAGIMAHVHAVCAATSLGVIFYNRDNAILDEIALERLCALCPNLVGFKDGYGDIELITRIYSRVGDRLTYIGGLPTAEMFALPYLEMGVTTYSSAIFNFLPQFAQSFYAAVRRGDREEVFTKLREFVLPYVGIRNRRKGYAVSIVKAGMRAVGRPAGPVRTPLIDLNPDEMLALTELIGNRT